MRRISGAGPISLRWPVMRGSRTHAIVTGAVFYPPLGLAAKVMAPMDPWIGRRTSVGAALLVLSATKPLEKRNETEPT